MRHKFPLLLLLLAGLFGSSGAARAQSELFQPVALEADQKLPQNMELAKRYQPVQINRQLLRELRPGQSLKLTPFPDRSDIVRIDAREDYLNGMVSLRGDVVNAPGSLFAITLCEDAVAIDLSVPFQPDVTLRYVSKGVHLVCERAAMSKNFCATPGIKEPVKDPLPTGGGIGVQAVNVIDILLFVTPQARVAWGGYNSSFAGVVNAINYTNGVHARSNTNAQLRPVNVIWDIGIDESGSYSNIISRFSSNSTVNTERTRHKADLCALFISRTDNGTNGIGNLPGVYSVNFYGDASWVAAHETGHNLGCGHAPNDPTHGGHYAYPNGHNHGDGFFLWLHTVMAYNRGAIAEFRIPYYSQPGVFYETSPGVTWETGTPDRNNARTIREYGATAAARQNITADVYVSPQVTWITSSGSQGAPWTQVTLGIDNVQAGGNVHIAGPFNYNQTFSYNKVVTLRLWSGTNPPVNIGKP